ncbi:hypothetical protein GOODEAATRI_024432 [Goodea atripinnis]|uniref:Thyroglobulin n=1 Tax=Goodea atripinnis TaxID=208336 RepID=A0ABV0PGQ4_9TELE
MKTVDCGPDQKQVCYDRQVWCVCVHAEGVARFKASFFKPSSCLQSMCEMCWPGFSSAHITEAARKSGPARVFDQHGCPLVIFPVDGQDKLLKLSKAEVVDFINYFHALLKYAVFRTG